MDKFEALILQIAHDEVGMYYLDESGEDIWMGPPVQCLMAFAGILREYLKADPTLI